MQANQSLVVEWLKSVSTVLILAVKTAVILRWQGKHTLGTLEADVDNKEVGCVVRQHESVSQQKLFIRLVTIVDIKWLSLRVHVPFFKSRVHAGVCRTHTCAL